jgi:uncharacterized membrane protein YdjX (TVP38/TMEM64 family)
MLASPATPVRVLSYALGATQISFNNFLKAMLMAMVPHMLPVTYAGSLARSVEEIAKNPNQLFVTENSLPQLIVLAITAIATIVFVLSARRTLKQI